jgi:hypothetical protein
MDLEKITFPSDTFEGPPEESEAETGPNYERGIKKLLDMFGFPETPEMEALRKNTFPIQSEEAIAAANEYRNLAEQWGNQENIRDQRRGRSAAMIAEVLYIHTRGLHVTAYEEMQQASIVIFQDLASFSDEERELADWLEQDLCDLASEIDPQNPIFQSKE